MCIDVAPEKKCNKCHAKKRLDQFRERKKDSSSGKKGTLTDKCGQCMDQEAAVLRAKRKRAAEPEAPSRDADDEELGAAQDKPVVTLADYIDEALTHLAKHGPFKYDARVDCSRHVRTEADGVEKGREVASIIGEHTMMRWSYEKKRNRVRTRDMVISYSCAQSRDREHKAKVPKENARSTMRMGRFDCSGWLHIVTAANSTEMTISMRHDGPHDPYVDIELPEKWKKYVEENALKLTPGQIWRHIVAEEGEGKQVSDAGVPYTSKTVYYYWHVMSRKHWKLDTNPIESAKKFILKNKETHRVDLLEVLAEPGTEVVAFQITDFMSEWAANTQELGMDSTWNTNGENFELFAAVAGAAGSGIPLAYLLIKTSKEAQKGAKQAVLERFMRELKKLGVNPEYTLSDKDWSEINAFRAVWPNAKHQLCFWHALRAVKQRLAKPKDTPAPYNPEEAKKHFSFISEDFVPAAQQAGDKKTPSPPEKPLPRLRLLVNGRPPVITPSLPKIRIPPRATQTSAALEEAEENFDFEDEEDAPYWATEREDDDDGWEYGSDDEVEDADDARVEFDKDVASSDSGDPVDNAGTPEHGADKGSKAKDPTYQFCPQAHRTSIIRLFGKHASQHPLLPERHGQQRTSEDIYRDAVREMYQHCELNHLCEVWAYMWNSWYSPDRWTLWTRAANPSSIPARRTTMMVEALWRNLKRLVLHQYNRPPVNLAVFALITKSLPPYRLTLSKILQPKRGGRPQGLTHMQEALKRSWTRLSRATIKGTYNTNLSRWTCDCGAQKYHANLLCKHLVQAAGPIPDIWWRQVTRFHLPPFYTVPIDGVIADAPESIRNYGWLARMGLEGPSSDRGDSESIDGAETSVGRTSQVVPSPSKPAPTGRDGLMRMGAGGGAGFELDDEADVTIRDLIRLLRFGADTLETQLDNTDPRFLDNALFASRRYIRWARNVERHQNRRTMPITNTARATDVIGYQYPSSSGS